MKFRRFVVWLMISSFLLARIEVFAQSHDQGVAAGTAANAVIRGLVNAPSATAVVPGYTNAPPETAYAGRPSLGADANAKLAACALTPNDPTCQALRNAVNSANTPRPAIGANDPAVAAASRIARNPSIDLGSLAAYYSGCTTNEVATPAGTTTKLCQIYSGIGNFTTRRDLSVEVELVPSCTAGDWFAHGEAHRNGADYMVADAQCRIRADNQQRFRLYAAGGRGACIGWQEVDLPTDPIASPRFVTDLSPHWAGYCWSPFKVVLAAGSGCTAGNCNYQFQFGTPIYACPAGSVSGNTLNSYWDGENPLCRQLDHVGHVHGVARARLQLDKLNPRWCPVCAVQPGHQAMPMRSECPLGIGDLGAAQFGGKATLDVVDLRRPTSGEQDRGRDEGDQQDQRDNPVTHGRVPPSEPPRHRLHGPAPSAASAGPGSRAAVSPASSTALAKSRSRLRRTTVRKLIASNTGP